MDFSTLQDKIEDKTLVLSLFGLGRIGLPTAVEFAQHGYKVIGVDVNKSLLEELKESKTFDDESNLEELLRNCNSKNMIEFTTNEKYAIQNSNIVVICVPTPINEDMGPDYSIIEDLAHSIGQNLSENQIIVIESSVSPTTIEHLLSPIIEKESNKKLNIDFAVCSCPERADPGKIIANFNIVTRIIGGSHPKVTKLISSLYRKITDAPIVEVSNPGTANAIKLTENIFRDVNIALINELAVLYEMLDVDIKEVIKGCSTKYNFQPHYPGPGVGGPCLPANPYYIIKDAAKVNHIPFLIRVAREVNDRMPDHIRDLVIHSLNMVTLPIKNTPITILGISYKADIKDIQISPSIKVIKLLLQLGAKLKIYDPYYKGEEIENFKVCSTLGEAVEGTKAIAILTDHSIFRDIDFKTIKDKNGTLVLIDSRNMYDVKTLPKGTIYCGVGRSVRLI